MNSIKKAAFIALVLLVTKLVIRLIPPADRFFSLFEMGIGIGLLIILIVYVILFLLVLIALVVYEKWKV